MVTARRVPLALYAHFPWCVQKCPYCDFNSHHRPDDFPESRYIDALLADLDQDLQQHFRDIPATPLVAIFMGGGTPSLFSPAAIGRFLAGVRARIPCTAEMEVTLEANPGTIEHGRFADYRAAGVNRVSLGAQSFSTAQLRQLGRIHGVEDIDRAAQELQRAGLANFNLDLMYALPGQDVAQALADVRRAIALQPAHLSHYQLTLEPGTAFYHQPPPLPEDELIYDMQVACQELLAGNGFRQYEVSAYARTVQSVHNRNYWEFGDYLGVGAGAHGKLTKVNAIVRTERLKSPRAYLESAVPARVQVRAVPEAELPFEFMLNALRLVDGFTESLFVERTELAWSSIEARIQQAVSRGLLAGHLTRWRPTPRGRDLLNDLIALFLQDGALSG